MLCCVEAAQLKGGSLVWTAWMRIGRGGWSIYCERQNDIAVIALHQPSDTERYAACLKRIHAKPIKEQLEAGGAALFQFERRSIVAAFKPFSAHRATKSETGSAEAGRHERSRSLDQETERS
jgi:hypothetical protein